MQDLFDTTHQRADHPTGVGACHRFDRRTSPQGVAGGLAEEEPDLAIQFHTFVAGMIAERLELSHRSVEALMK